jgi:hypothetical protein
MRPAAPAHPAAAQAAANLSTDSFNDEPDFDHTADLKTPEDELYQLAEQLERLLREEARRHGIDL